MDYLIRRKALWTRLAAGIHLWFISTELFRIKGNRQAFEQWARPYYLSSSVFTGKSNCCAVKGFLPHEACILLTGVYYGWKKRA